MTRIVAGIAGGRTLKVPPSGTRPTTERVREALFSRLEHLGVLAGARVLDLYAGSGALGLEAASRGAARVILVEAARTPARLVTHNARALGLAERCEVVTQRAETYLAACPQEEFDLVLVDPPYDVAPQALAGVLGALDSPGVLADGALVVVERATRSAAPTWPAGWGNEGVRTYGDTALWFAGPEPPAGKAPVGESPTDKTFEYQATSEEDR